MFRYHWRVGQICQWLCHSLNLWETKQVTVMAIVTPRFYASANEGIWRLKNVLCSLSLFAPANTRIAARFSFALMLQCSAHCCSRCCTLLQEIHELKDQIQDVEIKYTQNLKEVKVSARVWLRSAASLVTDGAFPPATSSLDSVTSRAVIKLWKSPRIWAWVATNTGTNMQEHACFF